jgi:hypothetical protein
MAHILFCSHVDSSFMPSESVYLMVTDGGVFLSGLALLSHSTSLLCKQKKKGKENNHHQVWQKNPS